MWNALGKRLLRVLDIRSKGVTSINLRLEPGAPPVVTLTRIIDLDEAGDIVEAFESYKLKAEQDNG